MAGIDDKVVAMSFENRKFEQGVNQTRQSLDKLKSSLQFPNAGKGLENVGKAADRLNLSRIGNNVDSIKAKFGYLSVAALAVFADIAMKAVQTGAQMVKAFTIQPIIQGFQEYSTNLNAIQTILANTQASGAGLKEVNAALQELNVYSDQTIYNFSEMARNIGTFTAAGVGLKPATAAIKGIANLAALSGSSSEQASTAMYQLSQAIAAGQVNLQDWNSVVNAGMGGTVFQRALAQTAVAMGTLKSSSLKLVGPMKNVSIAGQSFRQSIQAKPGQKSWLTSDVLTKTLAQFTGDMTDAQLATMGFNTEQIKAIQAQAKTAKQAATQVKTLSQVLDVAKETAGSGWAQTWQIVFGDFGEAKKTFTALSNAINGFINTSAESRNKVLKDWKALGGRTTLLNSIKIAFHNLGLIIKPIKEAFRDIFPAKTGKDLNKLTWQFRNFAKTIKPSPETVENLRRTFRGLFALLDIGKQIISGVFTFFKQLFGLVGGGKGGFLSLTASIGDFIVSIDKALKKGNSINKFFLGLAAIVAVPINAIKAFISTLGTLFTKFAPEGLSGLLSGFTSSMTPFQGALQAVANAWRNFLNSFDNSGPFFDKVFSALGDFGKKIGPNFEKMFSNINWDLVLDAVRTGLLVGLVVLLKEFLGKGAFSKQLSKGLGNAFKNLGGGFIKNANTSMKTFTGTMKSFQNNLKAKTMLEIAAAIALLAASIVALSFVDPDRLTGSMTAMTIMLGELIGAMRLIDKYISRTGAVKIGIVAAAMIALAIAIDLLTGAVFALSRLSWNELTKGLVGITVLLGSLSASSIVLSKNASGMIRAGISITAIAIGLNLMALAVRKFGSMDLVTLGKGLGGVAIGLGILALAMTKMPTTAILRQSFALIAIGIALNFLARAVTQLGSLDWRILAKGLGGLFGSLTGLVLAMRGMPQKSLMAMGASLILVSVALNIITKAVASMGALSMKQIGKGLIGLGGAMAILAIGLSKMKASVRGSIALGIAAGAIAVFTPALISLGKQSWKQIIKGLVALAAAFAIIGVAGLVLAPVAPGLIALGVALTLIGGALALAGVGIALIGVGLSTIAVAGPAALSILTKAFEGFLEELPKLGVAVAKAVVAMAQAFAKAAPQLVNALITIIGSLLDAIPRLTPKITTAIIALVDVIIRVLKARAPQIIQAGLDLLLALLRGISKNIGKLVTAAADVIVNFLTGLTSNLGRVMTAGTDVIVAFVTGLGSAGAKIVNAAVSAAGKFVINLAAAIVRLVDSGAQAMIDFLYGMGRVLEKREPEIMQAMAYVGVMIVKGLILGMTGMTKSLVQAAWDLIKAIPMWFLKLLGIKSPSTVFEEIGKNIVQGLVVGIDDSALKAKIAMLKMGADMVASMSDMSFDDILDLQPTITPILDLSGVQKEASKMPSIIKKNPLGRVSLDQAAVISSERVQVEVAKDISTTEPSGTSIKFEQNNYSPKSLSEVEIYRNTNNQLSKLKALLA